MLTEAVWSAKLATTCQVEAELAVCVDVGADSRQIFTVPSYEDDARMAPYLGWA